jgi:hypothetical protein
MRYWKPFIWAHQKNGRYFHRVGEKDFHAGLLVLGNDVNGEDGADGSKIVGLILCKNCIKKHNEAGVVFGGVDVKRERKVPKVCLFQNCWLQLIFLFRRKQRKVITLFLFSAV